MAWYIDVTDVNGTEIAGPFYSKQSAFKYKQIMEAYVFLGKKLQCSKPYKQTEFIVIESMNDNEKGKFYARLQKEKVKFQYYKKDGTLRKAYGTLAAEFLPEPAKSTDTKDTARDKMKRTFPADSVFYYDLDKKAFRSFKMKNFDKYLD